MKMNNGNIEKLNTDQHFRNKITLISFVCCLMVMWIHAHNLDTYGITSESVGLGHAVFLIENYWSTVITIAVPYFFLISGYLFFRTFDIHDVIAKYKSRIKGIVIPYIIWCSVYWFYFVAFTNIPFLKRFTNAEVVELSLKSYLMALWPNQYYTLWFLKNLIVFILVSPILFIALKDYGKVKVGTVVIIVLLMNSCFGWINLEISGIEYYCLGAYCAINHKEFCEQKKERTSALIGGLCLLGFLTLGYRLLTHKPFMYLALLLIWISLDAKELSMRIPWWFRITFFVYVSHDIVLEMFEKVVLLAFGVNPIFALLDYLFMPMIVFIILCLVACIMRKYTPTVWKIVTGGRV